MEIYIIEVDEWGFRTVFVTSVTPGAKMLSNPFVNLLVILLTVDKLFSTFKLKQYFIVCDYKSQLC